MYNQFFTIKPRISEKNGGSKVVHLIPKLQDYYSLTPEVLCGFSNREKPTQHHENKKIINDLSYKLSELTEASNNKLVDTT